MISDNLKENLLKLFKGEIINENNSQNLPPLTLETQIKDLTLKNDLINQIGSNNFILQNTFTFNDRVILHLYYQNQSVFAVLDNKLKLLQTFTQWKINDQLITIPKFNYVTLIKNQLLCVYKDDNYTTTLYQLTPFWDDYFETFLFTNQVQKLIDINQGELFADWSLIKINQDLQQDHLNIIIYSVSDIDNEKPVFKFYISPLKWGEDNSQIVWGELYQTRSYDGGLEDFEFFIETTNDGNFNGELVGSYHENHQQIAYVPTSGPSFNFEERDLLDSSKSAIIENRFNNFKEETLRLFKDNENYRYVKWTLDFDGYKTFSDGMWLGYQNINKFWDGPWGEAQDQLNQQRPKTRIIESDFDQYIFHFTKVPNDDWNGSNNIWDYGQMGGWLNEKQNMFATISSGLKHNKDDKNVISKAIVIGTWSLFSLGGGKPGRKWIHWDRFSIRQSFFKKTIFSSNNQISHMRFWTNQEDNQNVLKSEIRFFKDVKAYSNIFVDYKTFYLCLKKPNENEVKQVRFNVESNNVTLIDLNHDNGITTFNQVNWYQSLIIKDLSPYQLKQSLFWMSPSNELKLFYRNLSLHYFNHLTSSAKSNIDLKYLIGFREQNMLKIYGINQELTQTVVWQHSYNNQLPADSPYQFNSITNFDRDFLSTRILGFNQQDLAFDGIVSNIPSNEDTFIISTYIDEFSMVDQDVNSWSVWSDTNNEMFRIPNHVIHKNRNEVINLNISIEADIQDLTDNKRVSKKEALRHLILMFSTKGLNNITLKNQFKILEFYSNDELIVNQNPQQYFLIKNQKLYYDFQGMNGQGAFGINKLINKVILKNEHNDELMVKVVNFRPNEAIILQFKIEIESF